MSNNKTLKKRKNEVSGSDTSLQSGADSELEVHDQLEKKVMSHLNKAKFNKIYHSTKKAIAVNLHGKDENYIFM
jgi:hypothetical protein